MRLHDIHRGNVLGFAAVLAPTLGVFAPLMIAPLTILTILALLTLRFRQGAAAKLDRWPALIIGLLVVWTSFSLSWSINLDDSIVKWGLLAVNIAIVFFLIACGLDLAEHERRILRHFVLAGIAIGYAFIFFELATANAISQHVIGKDSNLATTVELFHRTDSVLFVFAWPAVAILWRRRTAFAAALIGLGFVAGYILPSASALIGYAAGTVVFLGALWAHRVVGAVLAATVFVSIMATPVSLGFVPFLDSQNWRQRTASINASLVHRLDIWNFTVERIAERPYLGWGFNAARVIPGGGEHYFLRDASQRVIGQGNRLPLHPHNGALQVWLELGLPGALGFSALFGLVALRAARGANRTNAAIALASEPAIDAKARSGH